GASHCRGYRRYTARLPAPHGNQIRDTRLGYPEFYSRQWMDPLCRIAASTNESSDQWKISSNGQYHCQKGGRLLHFHCWTPTGNWLLLNPPKGLRTLPAVARI